MVIGKQLAKRISQNRSRQIIYTLALLKREKSERLSGWLLHAVVVSSRLELLDSPVRSNVFNAVAKWNFVV